MDTTNATTPKPFAWDAQAGARIWACCPDCGRQAPRKGESVRLVAGQYRPFLAVQSDRPMPTTGARVWCGICGQQVPFVRIELRGAAIGGRSDKRCGGACLAGKKSCDCRCAGRCHGAGECQCGQVA